MVRAVTYTILVKGTVFTSYTGSSIGNLENWGGHRGATDCGSTSHQEEYQDSRSKNPRYWLSPCLLALVSSSVRAKTKYCLAFSKVPDAVGTRGASLRRTPKLVGKCWPGYQKGNRWVQRSLLLHHVAQQPGQLRGSWSPVVYLLALRPFAGCH